MLNDTSKSTHRPYVKKKTAKETKSESPSEARRRNPTAKPTNKNKIAGKVSFSLGGLLPKGKTSTSQDTEPDKRTKRAVSKKQYSSDRVQGFASSHARGIIVLTAIVISIWLMYPAVRGYYESKRNLEIYTAVADYITASNAEIEAKIESLNSEEGIKAHARERGLVDPGEVAIIIQEPEKPEPKEGEEVDPADPLTPMEGSNGKKDDEDPKDVKPASKGVEEKEKIQKVVESIRDEGSPMQKFLDFIFGYTPPDIKVF